MNRTGLTAAALAALLAAGLPAHAAGTMSMDDAVGVALSRNRDVIAAQLDVEASELDRVAARIYPNPVFTYSLGNLVLGPANPQSETAPVRAGLFDQTVHTFAVSELVDVWAKRSARTRAADRSIEHQRLLLEDALREVAYAVRSAYADVLREQSERDFAVQMRVRYDETVRISRARNAAGDISEVELKKLELEGLRYQNAAVDQQLELDLARQKLAELLAFDAAGRLPPTLADTEQPRRPFAAPQLIDQALRDRPDARAALAARAVAEATLGAARRERLPDISLGVAYTHSEFQVSGDNPNAFGLSLSLPLPLFDRNQAGIGRASLDIRRAENETLRVGLHIRQEVGDAVLRAQRAAGLLSVFESSMLERADSALRVAERSYKAGSVSLLELLEAQRTATEIHSQYLRVLHDYRQATVDVLHATGGRLN